MKFEQASQSDIDIKTNLKEEDPIISTVESDVLINDQEKDSGQIKEEQYIKIPLTEEELSIPVKELALRYNLSLGSGYEIKKRGYRVVDNPDHFNKAKYNKEKRERITKFLEEVTVIPVASIEALIVDKNGQELIKGYLEDYEVYKYFEKNKTDQKRFKLSNSQELSFGDLVIANKLAESKTFRNEEGQLMIFDVKKNEFTPFLPKHFYGQSHRGFVFRDNLDNIDNKKIINPPISLESFAPGVFKSGIFKEEDFDKRQAGSVSYEANGPHERKLSPNYPYAFLSNENGSAKYFLGRENFVGTKQKINHDTVRVTLLDNDTAAVTDAVNGRKVILYTFPLLTKDQYEKKKEEVINKLADEDKSKKINYNDRITVGVSELEGKFAPYSITSHIQKNNNESDIEYAERISRLSDTSYVLGNFRKFMSDAGLAANNYSWKDQLLLAEVLTKVEQRNKITSFSKNFGKNGLRTFLSIEQGGGEMGDKILDLGEKLPEEVAGKVFEKYGKIIDTADNCSELLKDILPEKIVNESEKEIRTIQESLLIRAKNLLSTFYDKKDGNTEELLKDLDRFKTEILLLGDSYKELKKSGKEVRLEDIKNIKITILSQEEKEKISSELWDITMANRPFIKDPEKIEKRKKEFFSTIENKDSDFYVLKHGEKGSIVAFCSFTPDKDGNFYAESLNIESEIKGSKIGGEFFPNVLERVKGFDKDIYGHVHPDNSGILNYYKTLGFEVKEEKENGELKYYEIRIPTQQESSLAA